MLIRMLGPAGPVSLHRPASFRASVRGAPPGDIRTVWDWGDGELERVRQRWVRVAQVRRTHRYRQGGVYRLQVRGDAADVGGTGGTRYVAVRARGQLAASGWIVDPAQPPVPFGFVITPASGGDAGSLEFGCLIGGGELAGQDLGWLMNGGDGRLHFGGAGRIGRDADVRFRVDVDHRPEGASRAAPHLTMSIYAAGMTPGRDAPAFRVSGPVRPGRVDLGPARAS